MIFDMISDEFLKKNYRKIARRSNLGLVEQTFRYKATNADELIFERGDTWEICLVTSHVGDAFSFIHKVFLIGHRFQQACSVPSRMIIQILQTKWRLSDETMTNITESLCAKELSLPAWQPKLPSHRNKAQLEGHVQLPLKFSFKWINAPYYATDLSVYVFRLYGKYPQIRPAIVVVNNHNTLAELGHFLPAQVFQHDVSGLPYIMQVFQVVCTKVTDELVTFLTKTCDDINYMVYEGRLRPSGSKMQYLRHLEDCQHAAKECCRQNRSTLQMLLDQANVIQGPRSHYETNLINELEMVVTDLNYFHDEIESSLRRISGVCRDIREQLDIVQIRRTSILGILAGLYLPLAFVTSFLGMNLNQFTQPQPSWRNATHIDVTNPENFTISHSKIVDSGANQAWSLQNFFEIAIPLVVGTILAPLVIGSVIRAFLRALRRGRTWWRLIFTLFVICYSTFSGIATRYFTMGLVMFAPFSLFVGLNMIMLARRKRIDWLGLIVWFVSTCCFEMALYYLVDDAVLGITGAVYGISFFLVWWLRPNFYYRWDQGRRPKAKES
ncbi:unnamed protein product [Penicillium nalgiovense]|nr:unnamed protein product [Penicillium nalgiovense]